MSATTAESGSSGSWVARCNAVFPPCSALFLSAPASNSTFTTLGLPLKTAQCKAVEPSSVALISRSERDSSNNSMQLAVPTCAAKCSAGQPSRSLASGFCGRWRISSSCASSFCSHAETNLASSCSSNGQKSRITSCKSTGAHISWSSKSSPAFPFRILCLNLEQPTWWERYFFSARMDLPMPGIVASNSSTSRTATSAPDAAEDTRNMLQRWRLGQKLEPQELVCWGFLATSQWNCSLVLQWPNCPTSMVITKVSETSFGMGQDSTLLISWWNLVVTL